MTGRDFRMKKIVNLIKNKGWCDDADHRRKPISQNFENPLKPFMLSRLKQVKKSWNFNLILWN